MFNIKENKIEISRGDTGTMSITFGGDVPYDGTIALVTLQKTLGYTTKSTQNVWQKRLQITDGSCLIRFSSDDTNHPAGKYLWDLRLLYSNGDIYTPIKPTEFNIIETVGDV